MTILFGQKEITWMLDLRRALQFSGRCSLASPPWPKRTCQTQLQDFPCPCYQKKDWIQLPPPRSPHQKHAPYRLRRNRRRTFPELGSWSSAPRLTAQLLRTCTKPCNSGISPG